MSMEDKTKLMFEGIDLLELSPVQGITIREIIPEITEENEKYIRKQCLEVNVDPDALLKTAQLNAKLQEALRAVRGQDHEGSEVKMIEKLLGKIEKAEYGTIEDLPFMMGLQLTFSLSGGVVGVGDAGKYTVNMSKACKWKGGEIERDEIVYMRQYELYELLKRAKVNFVSELKNKPVEVTLEDYTFKDFRILTEVL